MWYVTFSLALLAASVVFAMRHGKNPEKSVAIVLIAMETTDLAGHALLGRTYTHIDPTALAVDFVGLIGLAGIALSTSRFWPIWASSLQLLSVSAHLIRAIDFRAGPFTYALMKTGPTQAIVVMLLLATYRQRAGRTTSDRS